MLGACCKAVCRIGISRNISRRGMAVAVRKRTVSPLQELNFDDDINGFDSESSLANPSVASLTARTTSKVPTGLRRTSGAVKKMISTKNLEISIEEETILELVRDLSPTPVTESEMPYVEFIDLPVAFTLPPFPKKLNENNINKYLSKLTSQSYHPNFHGTVVSKIMQLVREHPEWITKRSYVAVVSLLHFILKSNVAFEVLDIMQEETDIVQDVDFMNAFLMVQNCPTVYKFRINRLESFRDRNRKINLNTWYYLFTLFESPGAKLELLNMMLEFDIPVKPIFNKSAIKLTKALSPEELTDLYSHCGISLDPFFFNVLISAFLNNNRVGDAWALICHSINNKDSHFVTDDTYKTFIDYFCERDELPMCFAFEKLWFRVTGKSNEVILKSTLLNEYLTECPYFTAWGSVVKICRVKEGTEDKRKYIPVTKRANWAIHDYAIVHSVPEPASGLGRTGKLLRDRINKTLDWPTGEPIFELNKNSPEFIETANLLGQS